MRTTPRADPHATDGDHDPSAHVGCYLIGEGRARLERAAGMRASLPEALRRVARRIPLGLYAGSIAAFTVAATALLLAQARHDGLGEPALVALGVLLLLAASQTAVGMVNWLATLLTTPKLLPRMDFTRGLPSHARTLVVVPTMLVDVDGIDALVEALEVRFLANRDHHLHFGLLTDFVDAAAESLPGDAALLARARAGIEALNAKYPRTAQPGEDERGRRHVLPLSSPAPVQSARNASGWGTSASAASSRT